MNVEDELRELERMWCHWPAHDEVWRRLREGVWGERIREVLIGGIRSSERNAIENAVVYLEVGPRYFRSGYYRGWIARALKRAPLTSEQRRRLRKVVLRDVTSRRVGFEFRELARLAIVVADEDFISRLKLRRRELDGWTLARCELVLELCARHARIEHP